MEKKQSWWEGPNVCKTVSESHDNSSLPQHALLRHLVSTTQSCDVSDTAYKCRVIQQSVEGRLETTTVYHCCHEYSRDKGEFGCPTRHELTDLLATVDSAGLTDFSRTVRLLDMSDLLEEGNFTVFAPVNGALDLDTDVMTNSVDVILGGMHDVIAVSKTKAEMVMETLEELVLGHIVSGSLTSSVLEDEQLLQTANDKESSIRINYFNRAEQPQLMTANCVPLLSRDVLATNGVLYSVEKALTPVTESLLDLVKSRQDLSMLKTVLAAAEYVSTMNDEGSVTLLAPTNSAFEKMNPRLRERLLRGDQACVQKVLQNHLLKHVICSGALTGQHRSPNLLQKMVNLTVSEDGKVFADGAQLVQTDVMATNGVMHVVDQVLVPEEALDFLDVLENNGFTEFLALVDKAGLTKTFENTDNVTIFAPTNEAIQGLPETVKAELADKDVLAEVLSYHVTPGLVNSHRFHDNLRLTTLASNYVRINTYQVSPFSSPSHSKTAQCAPIRPSHLQACNARINVIGKVMLPPPGNVLDVLALDSRFSKLVSLIKKSGLADKLQADGPYTIFAPNNEAFAALGQKTLDRLTSDQEELTAFISKHIFENALCCAGIQRSRWYYHPQVRVMSGDLVKLHRGDDHVTVGGVKVVTCDRTATNGVVLELGKVLLRQNKWSNLFHGWTF